MLVLHPFSSAALIFLPSLYNALPVLSTIVRTAFSRKKGPLLQPFPLPSFLENQMFGSLRSPYPK
ncbi:hypothetical protein TGS27_2777 [Geobacillus stearothermophilus]|uniref:Uncharacterized protein n=1 Tax=Geobacillus stearothermophilus TaxID=1422 RepID=A0A150MQB0_GEOSE|nr:hypothetical protein B4109_0277 [Geobacillus stearothermophilus]KYD34992.1 hypothetical protein B4114_0277 [Geobacillus stearothermophilus]OAO77440.1 hypothetical protein TGS27_2777 [Geobacillus stearothermophilus]